MPGPGEAGSPATPAAAASGAAEGAEGAAAAAAAAAPGAETPPATPEPGAEGQHQITVGGKVFKTEDVQGILNAKIGLEKQAKEYKARLDALDLEGKTELEKSQVQLQQANARIAELNQTTINSVVQAQLDKAKIPLQAANLNLGIETVEEASAKVQQFITDNPGLAGAAAAGGVTTDGSPGASTTGSPAGAPPGTDKEAQLVEQFKNATNPQALAAAEKALAEFRGGSGGGGRTIL